MNHSPGPWAIDSELPPNARCVIARTTGRQHLAISANTTDPAAQYDERADARLIAAAPDLLAACKEALSRLDDTTEQKSSGPMGTILCLQAAIAKAEGTP